MAMAERQTIIITGGGGLIGSALVKRFVLEYDVAVLEREEPHDLPAGAIFYDCDVTSAESVDTAIRGVADSTEAPIASVLHLAAYYDFSGEPSDLYEKVTVQGTRRVLEALKRAPMGVEQFVFSSTMLVHKPRGKGRPISEDDPLEARWDYPQSKIDTERVIREDHDGIPAVLLRIAGVYTDDCNSIPIAHQIQRIRERRLTGRVFPGDITHGQAFVHLDDLVDAFARTVARRGTLPSEVPILIGEPETYSYDQLQRRIAELVHGDDDWTTQEIPKAIAKTGAWVQDHIPGVEEPFIKPWMIDVADDEYDLDISRAENLLGWRPRHRLIDTLPAMVESLQRDPAGWYERNRLETPAGVGG